MSKKFNALYDLTVTATNGDKYKMYFLDEEMQWDAHMKAIKKGLTTDLAMIGNGMQINRTAKDNDDLLHWIN